MMRVIPLNHVPMYVSTHNSRPNYIHKHTHNHFLFAPLNPGVIGILSKLVKVTDLMVIMEKKVKMMQAN